MTKQATDYVSVRAFDGTRAPSAERIRRIKSLAAEQDAAVARAARPSLFDRLRSAISGGRLNHRQEG